MKILCFKKDLKDAVSFSERNFRKNLNLAILGNILLDAEGKDLKFNN